MPSAFKACRGLSLFDLLITLAVLAILAQWLAPGFSGLIAEQRRLAFAHELASDLRSARLEAVQRNRTVIVHPLDGDWTKGWQMVVDESGKGMTDPNNPVVVQRLGDASVRVAATQNLREQLAFDYLGVPRLPNRGALAGTFHLCEAGNEAHRRVVVARTGRVRITREGPPTSLCPA
ncbi:GspH/FimT family pseudopilin [Pseudomonas sp. DC3000-4b1]|uniref:GspH/FimT family pseudopilin n=1 Tax=unclassified Pseudomonas TaxID=196821 RepID=UPI003CF0E5FB